MPLLETLTTLAITYLLVTILTAIYLLTPKKAKA